MADGSGAQFSGDFGTRPKAHHGEAGRLRGHLEHINPWLAPLTWERVIKPPQLWPVEPLIIAWAEEAHRKMRSDLFYYR